MEAPHIESETTAGQAATVPWMAAYLDSDQGLYGFYRVTGPAPFPSIPQRSLLSDESIEAKELVIAPQFQQVRSFSGGKAAVKKGESWQLIDATGAATPVPDCDEVGMKGEGTLYDGRAAARKGDLWGFIDAEANWVITPIYQQVQNFSEGIAAVKVSGKSGWTLIDPTGKELSRADVQLMTHFSEGLAACLPHKGGWCYINREGKTVIPRKSYFSSGKGFEMAAAFSQGRALVQEKANRYTFIDQDGKRIGSAEYAGALGFSHGLAAVQVADKWGFLDLEGKLALSCEYDHVSSFYRTGSGTIQARVRKGDQVSYILRDGSKVQP